MIEISISNLVTCIGIFFLLGIGIGIYSMVKVVKKELDKLEEWYE